jgi:hypothetical protein
MQRVMPAYRAANEDLASRESVWLIIERPDDEPDTKYYFASLPDNWSKKRLIRLLKQRWRTERVYEDLKGELGLDHYEGRRYSGWHHHVSVVPCCYAFVVAERARLFSLRPDGRKPTALTLAACAPLRRLLHDHALGDRPGDQLPAPALPFLPSREPQTPRPRAPFSACHLSIWVMPFDALADECSFRLCREQ